MFAIPSIEYPDSADIFPSFRVWGNPIVSNNGIFARIVGRDHARQVPLKLVCQPG